MSNPGGPDVVADISVLYELALAVGTSLDCRQNSEHFVKTLMARKDLAYAAVWLRQEALEPTREAAAPGDGDGDGVELVFAHPEFRIRERRLPGGHPMVRELERRGAFAATSGSPGFAELMPESEVSGLELAVLPLGDLGLLELHSLSGGARFDEVELTKLASVVRKFALSVEGCLAHTRLLREVERRGETEARLQAATGRLATLIDNLQSAVLFEDRGRRLRHANRAFCELFEIPVGPEELRGVDCSAAAAQAASLFADPEGFLAGIDRTLAAGELVTAETLDLADGRTLERDYVPLTSGEEEGHLWLYRDVTERRRAEEELATLSLVASHTDSAVIITDRYGRAEWVNEAFTTLTGYEAEEFLGRVPGETLRGPETDPEAAARIERAFATCTSFEGEILNYRKSGEPYWIDLTATPVLGPTGELERFIAIQSECTERREAERRLRDQQDRMRLLLGNALDAFVSIDESGRLTAWNPQAEQIFGYSTDEALGRPMADLIIPTKHRDGHAEGMRRFFRTGHGPVLNRRIEIEAQRSDGSEFPVELTIYPIQRGEGFTFSAFIRDISERRQIERMKDELISTVSHELRTPLTSLRGFVELMRERDYAEERRQEFLTIIHEETMRLSRLLDDFLDIQRLEAGRQEFRFESLELGELLADTVGLFRARSDEHALELAVEPGLPAVTADADRLRQVVANLLSNAVKFSPDGGCVEVAARRVGDLLEVSVSDRGLGIPEEALPRIFEKFSRVERPETREIGGSGLGLHLVRQIVRAHGGEVRAESRLGEGSRFSFTLPADGAA